MRKIDNSKLLESRGLSENSAVVVNRQNRSTLLKKNLKEGKEYAMLNRKVWAFLTTIYGGGPEIRLDLHP
jgi:hypothetical protein